MTSFQETRSAGASSGRLRRALARRGGIRLFRFFARDLSERADVPRPAGVAIELLSQADVLAHCLDPELDLRAETVRAAYARGDLCVGALNDGRLVGYSWLAFGPLPHLDGVWVRFGASTAWTYKSLVRASHRGRGIAAGLYVYGDAVCAEHERRRSVICVESHNQPSVKAALRASYRPAGYGAYVVRAMPLLEWCSPAARAHGVAFMLPRAAAAATA